MKLTLSGEDQEFFESWKQGYHREEDAVRFIKTHLLTREQKLYLFEQDLDVYDLLNGRITGEQEAAVEKMFVDWNEKLGHHMFGF